ncbi:alpha-ketoglutarate-dependent dioxygenase AlkB [Lewinella sp. W8]|uniref:alpha-ketoglutarate-dependent dioxygenase AlkB n=1 Tax=Lewinella sp. W8 TaxID=2528208 RepID=UPI0015641605|nr:alpha-ketoglutarate-dependent dioxygenase AlkB [Lewinella sp. W8]
MNSFAVPNLNCEAHYWPDFLSAAAAWRLYHHLVDDVEIPLNTIEVAGQGTFTMETGKLFLMDREIHASGELAPERWGRTRPWTAQTREIRDRVRAVTGHHFHTGVCIRYPDGNTGVAYHHDPSAFGDTTYIASLSLGAERKFLLREKATGREHAFTLAHGSLFLMGRHCQERYEHAVPNEPEVRDQRVNITFRKYGHER